MKNLVLCVAFLAGCASTRDVIEPPVAARAAAAPAAAAPAPAGVVELTVTDAGFFPEHVSVARDQPVTLRIKRETDATCAKDIVIPEHGIQQALPLGETVEVTFTPSRSGELRYGCSMDQMVGGVLLVE